MTIHSRRREQELKEKWQGVNDATPVNDSQYSLDSKEREEAYIQAQFTSEAELATYRQYREEWYRRAKEFDPGEVPLSVGCELVSTCNLNCSMCYTITEEFQNSVIGDRRMLPWPVVKAIIDEAAMLGVPSMLFSWRGESTLYRWRHEDRVVTFPDVLAYARQQGILEVTSLTHGQLIDDDMAEKIVAAAPNWISFSIDGLADAYNKIRTPKSEVGGVYDAFAVVSSNIRRLVAARDRAGLTRPQIRTNTVYPAIAHDVDAYVKFMQSIGVGWITINELLDFRGRSLPDSAIQDNWNCQYPFQRLMVSASGSIVPCTGAHREESALVIGRYQGAPAKILRDAAGNVVRTNEVEVTLAQAWASKKLNGIRKIHQQGDRKSINPGCRSCRHGAVKNGLEWCPPDWDFTNMKWGRGVWRM